MMMMNPSTLRVRAIVYEEGATGVEYALMVALIALVIIGAVTALGLAVPGLFTPAADTLSSHLVGSPAPI